MFNPSTFTEGSGGLVDNVDATLKFRCVSYDYNGAVATAVPALHVQGTTSEGVEFNEYYSAGDAARLRPSADGKTFEPVTEGASLNKQSKAAQFIASLFNAGLQDLADDDITTLDGINVHLERRADQERKGINATNSKGRQRTILLVTAINALPGAKAKGKGKVGGANIDAEVDAVVESALEAAGGEIVLAKLSQAVFKAGKGNPKLKDITKRAQEADYLEGDRPFGFDGTKLFSA